MQEIKTKGRKIMFALLIIGSVLIGLSLIIIIGGIITVNFVYTPPFKDANENIITGSITEFQRVTLGGNSQAVLIRGRSLDNPVILFLHMGPGLTETGLMRNINARLEDYFIMVYLDQRGGSKSYSFFNNPVDFNTEQLVQDIHELTLYLKEKLNKEKIIIMGHSFGAPFGLLAVEKYPEDYSAYIGIGQPVCPVESNRLSYTYYLDIARKEKNMKAIEELEKIEGFWRTKDMKAYTTNMMLLYKWIGYFGGQMHGENGFTSFFFENTMCHEYTVFDWPLIMAGSSFSGAASTESMLGTDMRKLVTEVKVPFIIMQGRYDYTTNCLAEDYLNIINAPLKKIYWFENSAHFPHYEEKEFFQKIMIEEIQPLVMND